VQFPDTIQLDVSAARAHGRLFVHPDWELLRDHFPGAPVLPGLLMLQAAVRTGAALLAGRADAADDAELESLERLQVIRRVGPGETFSVETTMVERTPDGTSALFTADGHVGGATAMRARFRLRTITAWSTA
jgi:3-hydroxyacyl-[acyl-carrier-protein] dehydratase